MASTISKPDYYPASPPPSYPAQSVVHHGAPYQPAQSPQPYYQQPPPQQPGVQGYSDPYAAQQGYYQGHPQAGMQYAQGPGYQQPQAMPPPQGHIAGGRRGDGSKGGIVAALCGALACCCCLDILF